MQGCLAKFLQNKSIQQTLLQTGYRKLIQHANNDDYWGDGGNGTGKNRLGTILEIVRTGIRDQLKIQQN